MTWQSNAIRMSHDEDRDCGSDSDFRVIYDAKASNVGDHLFLTTVICTHWQLSSYAASPKQATRHLQLWAHLDCFVQVRAFSSLQVR